MKTIKKKSEKNRNSNVNIPRENIWYFTEGTIIENSVEAEDIVDNNTKKQSSFNPKPKMQNANNPIKRENSFVVDWQISGMF